MSYQPIKLLRDTSFALFWCIASRRASKWNREVLYLGRLRERTSLKVRTSARAGAGAANSDIPGPVVGGANAPAFQLCQNCVRLASIPTEGVAF